MTVPKYKQVITTVTVYSTSNKSFGVNIPIKLVRDMQLKKGERIEVTIKKIEEEHSY